MMMEPLPALRRMLETVPIRHDGQDAVLVRDLEKLIPAPSVLTPLGMLIASLLDGKSTAREVCALFTRHAGIPLSPDDLASLVEQLKSSGLLETPEIERLRRKRLEEFQAAAGR